MPNPNHDERGRFSSGDGSGLTGTLGQTSQVVQMPVDALLHYSRIDPYGPDSDREYMSRMEETVRTQGLGPDAFKNLPVIEVGESGSHAVITDGNHRLWAASRIGLTHVPVVLNTGEDDDWARRYGKPVEPHLQAELIRISHERPTQEAKKEVHSMDLVTKSVDAAVKPVESEHPNGEFEVILSTEALDRDDENLWADEWKQPLPARIHIDGDHGRTLEKTVGSAVPHIDGNRMIGKGTYAGTEYAQMVRQLVNEGHINSVSVTYAERKNQKDNGIQRELLNAAFVAIPANPEAVVLASKSAKRDLQAEEAARRAMSEAWKKSRDKADGGVGASGNNPEVKHDDMVQAIHDAAFQLGAQCLNDVDADPGTSDGANKSVFELQYKGSRAKFDNWDDANEWLKQAKVWTDKGLTYTPIETSSSKDAGSPQESAEESAAPAAAAKAAAADAADNSADNAAHQKAKEAEKARALAWLIGMNTKD